MTFQNRQEAGKKLAEILSTNEEIIKNKKNTIILSLIRGGAVVGFEIAKKLSLPHYPLIVKKISSPFNEELALGALCEREIFLEKRAAKIDKKTLEKQIRIAKEKLSLYKKSFSYVLPSLKNKTVILVDDGVATGATVKVACQFLRKKKVKKIILAVPVVPSDFDKSGFDQCVFLFSDPWLTAVSSYYQDFHQVSDEEVKKIFCYNLKE